MRFILHIGTAKTGTTAIQRILSENRSQLRKQNAIYPNTQPLLRGSSEAHHRLAHAFTEIDPEQRQLADGFLDRMIANASRDTTIIISAEAISRHIHGKDAWNSRNYWRKRKQYLLTLSNAIKHRGFDVEAVVFLRRQDEFAESLYKEMVIKGLTNETFENFLISKRPIFDYTKQVQLYKQTFDDIRVYSYHGGPVINMLLRDLEVKLGRFDNPWVRSSPDSRLILWILQSSHSDVNELRNFVRSEIANTLFSSGEPTTMWQSTTQRQGFLRRFQGDYGADFFSSFSFHTAVSAILTDEDRKAIEKAFQQWQSAC